MEIVATFSITQNLEKVRKPWEKEAQNHNYSGTSTRPKVNLGGAIVELNLQGEILKQNKLHEPTGFCINEDKLYVCTIRSNKIEVLDKNLRNLSSIHSPIFNDLHSVKVTNKNLLVTSTGYDTVAVVNESGNVLWMNNLFKYEKYSKSPLGKTVNHKLSKDISNLEIRDSEAIPTLYQSTHVNGATIYSQDDNYIIMTLFHQGEIVLLNNKTGDMKVLFNNLWCPHSFKEYPNFYSVCDSRNNKVILFEKGDLREIKHLKVIKEIESDYKWVQDYCYDGKYHYIADANNHRICTLDENYILIHEIKYSPEWRIHQFEVLS